MCKEFYKKRQEKKEIVELPLDENLDEIKAED